MASNLTATTPLNEAAAKNQAPIPTPVIKTPAEIFEIVKRLIKEKKTAQLITKDEVGDLLPHAEFGWEGEKEWPIFLGYPYVHRLEDNSPSTAGLGNFGPLIPVYFDSESHCTVFVRADAYPS